MPTNLSLILPYVYIVVGFSITVPALTNYLKLWVSDFPWLFILI